MPVTFYPHEDDLDSSTLAEKIEVLMEAAERYKAAILETGKTPAAPPAAPTAAPAPGAAAAKKRIAPSDIAIAYNWEEIAKLLRQIREMPEVNQAAKLTKADHLTKLAAIYEVLRGAKMPKLEAVRLALMNEANQLRGTTQVA